MMISPSTGSGSGRLFCSSSFSAPPKIAVVRTGKVDAPTALPGLSVRRVTLDVMVYPTTLTVLTSVARNACGEPLSAAAAIQPGPAPSYMPSSTIVLPGGMKKDDEEERTQVSWYGAP